MVSLFDQVAEENQPLAARVRPRNLDEYFGQTQIVGPGKILRNMIERGQLSSMIFWGPPGVSKTTLANIIATHAKTNHHTDPQNHSTQPK